MEKNTNIKMQLKKRTLVMEAISMLFLCFISTSKAQELTRVKRGSGGRGIALTTSVILDIVNKHNNLRGSVSSSDMRRMTWDAELSSIAQNYGIKCQFSHNTEGSHSVFKNSIGENIFVSSSSYENFDSNHAVQLWFDEQSDFTYSTRTCAPGKKCGHYTQVVWSSSYKVGCSLTMCDHVTGFAQPNSHLFICNYSPAGNVHTVERGGTTVMLSPFQQGPPCSACKNISDTCTEKLCSNGYRDRDLLHLINSDDGDSNNGLIIAVVLLSLAFSALLFYTIFRKQIIIAFNRWRNKSSKTSHAKFSNQNTPQPSRSTTPRPSIVVSTLHGTSRDHEERRKSSVVAPSPLLGRTNKKERPKSRDVQRLYEPKNRNPPGSPSKPLRPPPPQGISH